MSKNIFFKSKGPFKLNKLFPNTSNTKILIKDVKTLDQANQFDLTFLTHWIIKKLQKILELQLV